MVPRALPRLRIATACNADWNAMVGSDRARFCGACCQTVYNVENLRPREVAALFERHGDRLPCLRLYQRPDGTVVTRGCLTWVTAGARRVRMGFLSVAAMAVGFWSNVFLWRGRLHDEATPGPTVTAVARPPFVVPAPPARTMPHLPDRGYMMGIPPPPPEWQERIDRLRGPGPTEATVKAAVHSAWSQFRQVDLGSSRSGRVAVTVTIRPNGRVSSVRLEAPADLLTAAGHKRLERVVRGISFPRSGDEYQAEFPVIFQGQ